LDGDFPSATFDESAIRCHFPELWTPGLANLPQLLDAPAVTEGPLKRSMFGFWKQRDFIHPVIRLPISPIFQCIIMPVVCLLHAPRPRLRGKTLPNSKHNTIQNARNNQLVVSSGVLESSASCFQAVAGNHFSSALQAVVN